MIGKTRMVGNMIRIVRSRITEDLAVDLGVSFR
jgi:hypothetical protein